MGAQNGRAVIFETLPGGRKRSTMKPLNTSIQLATSDPDALARFYRETVGLEPESDMGPHALALSPAATLFLVDHSQVSGPTREPARAIIDLHITGLDAEQARLEAAGVRFTRSKAVEYWGGVISTFNDPDGNIVQLIEFRPELARDEELAAASAG
jgi:predicted enzyme related to lactoylglutathione lyase